MGYTNDPAMVEVNFFKPQGKWYCTEAVLWLTWNKPSMIDGSGKWFGKNVYDAFEEALKNHLWNERDQRYRLGDMWAICNKPYHENEFPLMIFLPLAVAKWQE